MHGTSLMGEIVMIRRIALVAGLALVVAAPALAGWPIVGTYKSTDLGGSLDTGRFSESWLDTAGVIGNTLNLVSWDGSVQGGEWKVWCMSLVSPPTLIIDIRDANGNGQVMVTSYYGGGSLWLSRNGPWGDGTEDYAGEVHVCHMITTYQYASWELIGAVGSINLSGMAAGGRHPIDLSIYLVEYITLTGGTSVPADYPPLIDADCGAGPATGTWGDVGEITLSVLPPLPVEASTWGAVKALYGN